MDGKTTDFTEHMRLEADWTENSDGKKIIIIIYIYRFARSMRKVRSNHYKDDA